MTDTVKPQTVTIPAGIEFDGLSWSHDVEVTVKPDVELAKPEHSSAVHGDLDRVPGVQNWIERLPAAMRAAWKKSWIYRTAKHLHADADMTISRAIAVAVNAAKRGCASGDLNFRGVQNVNKASRAEMCAAVTLWESMKAASGKKTMAERFSEEDFDPKRFVFASNIGQITLKEDYFGPFQEDSAFIEAVFGLEVTPEAEIDQILAEEAAQKAILSAFSVNEGPEYVLERYRAEVELVAATVDSAGRVWKQAAHPRGAGGTFTQNGASGAPQDNPQDLIKQVVQTAELGKLNKYRGLLLKAALSAAQTGQIAQIKGIPPEIHDDALEAVSAILTHAGFSQGVGQKGRQMSENIIYQLPYELSEPEKVGKKLWRKHLLPLNKVIKHGGETLEFTKETLSDMVNSFKEKAYDAVYATVGHTTEADKGRGLLSDLFIQEDGDPETDGLYGDFELSPEGEKILENNLNQIGTSVAFKPIRHREADGRTFKNALQHVAFVPTPAVPGLRPWEPIQLSDDSETAFVNLTGAHYEPHDTRKESGPVSEVVVETQDTDKEEVEMQEPKIVTEEESNVVSLEEFEQMKRELAESKAREEKRAEDNAKTARTLRRQGIRKMLNEQYLADGVPPAKCDAAFTLLSSETEESLIELSEDGDASVGESEKAQAIVELLEGYKGQVQFGEAGTSEESTSEVDSDARIRAYMKENGVDYRTAMTELGEEVTI